ncbi:MAG: hypothetical protein IJD40_02225 [Lachnospiraceae bacterium]|nr:hypothetical protein [Lachnospiraceae bacterium]
MPTSKNTKEVHNNKASRRNRVNQIKSLIVFAAVLLLFTSVILNVILVFKVLKLEGQIDKLYSQNYTVVKEEFCDM